MMTTTRGSHRLPVERRSIGPRALITIVAALALVVAVSSVAFGYFSSAGTGTGTATTGTLNAPTAVAGTQVAATSNVNVSWTAPTGLAPTGYYVLRTPSPSGAAVAACGTSPGAPTTGTSCTDTGVALGAYTYVVVALNATWTSASAPSAVVNVVQTTPTITFTPVTPANAGTTATLAATSNSPGAFTYSTPSSASICTVTGNQVTYVGAGSCVLTASQAAAGIYSAGSASATVVVTAAKLNQTITFNPPVAARPSTSATLTATATSGLPVTFSTSSAGTICTVSGTTVTYVGVGDCVITANQAGNATYNPAPAVTKTVVVDNTAPTISNIQPVNGASGLWANIDCSTPGVAANSICASVTDNVGVVSVTYKLQKNSNPGNGNCWNGTSFAGGSACTTPPSMTALSGSLYVSSVIATGTGAGGFTSGSYTLTIVATDAAGNSTTSTTTFTRS